MTGLFAGCVGWVSLIAVRLGMGAAKAGIFPASTTTTARWFPRTQWAMPNGALGGCMQFGGAIGAMLTGVLIVNIGWRWMFLCYAIPGIVWALWFWKWFRNNPEDHRHVNSAELSVIRRDSQTALKSTKIPRRHLGEHSSQIVRWRASVASNSAAPERLCSLAVSSRRI